MKECADKNDNKIVILKLSLYLISLWMLLFMLIILKADVTNIQWPMTKLLFKQLIQKNVMSLFCLSLIFLGIIGYIFFLDSLNNAKNLPVEIEECESVNYENLSFLATYIIPLVCFPMETERQIFVMFSVIIVIGCIFVKTNLYYTNPSLVLLGFNVYKVRCKSGNAFGTGIVIIKGKLNVKDNIKYMSLSDNVYFARRI